MDGGQWSSEVQVADWIVDRIGPFDGSVGSVVPSGFEAYARVFHPIVVDGQPPRRWSDVALANGRIAHAQMQLHMISCPPGTPVPQGDLGPGFDAGSLPAREREVLVELLRPATTSPERCWYCVWDGWGAVEAAGTIERVSVPHRRYLLTSGPLERALQPFSDPLWERSANIWWPDDRAWVVATEVDFAWTYVGGPRTVIDRIVADDRVEAMEARLTDRVTYDGDVVNAALHR